MSFGGARNTASGTIGIATKIAITTKILLSTLFLDYFFMQNSFLTLLRR